MMSPCDRNWHPMLIVTRKGLHPDQSRSNLPTFHPLGKESDHE